MNIQKTIIITKHPHIDCLVSKKKIPIQNVYVFEISIEVVLASVID